MVTFITERISNHIIRIHGLMDEQMYLVEGKQRAALIDTGSGAGSLKECVRRFTDKPIIVLLTHGHLDHAMGAGEFDEIYMNHRDQEIYEEHRSLPLRKLFLSDAPAFADIKESDYAKTLPATAFHDLQEGDVFDLGGISIETFACPGHTAGSMVFLFREDRMLLTGDACNKFTFLYAAYSTTLSEYERNLRKLIKKVDGKYDRVLLSHGDSNAHKEILQEVLDVCKDIRDGKAADIPFSYRTDLDGSHGFIAKAIGEDMMRIDGKEGNIVYNPERIVQE